MLRNDVRRTHPTIAVRRLAPALVAAVAALALSGRAGEAQSSTTRGFQLGVHLGGAGLQVRDGDRSNGGGGGVRFGYGVNRSLTLFFQADGTTFDVENDPDVSGTWTMGHVDLGGRFNFANSLRRWVPYLQGSFTGRVVSLTDIPAGNPLTGQDVSFSGGAFTIGGGVMVYTSQGFAIDLGLLFSGGQFTELTVGNTTRTGYDIDAQSSRFNVGLSWWP